MRCARASHKLCQFVRPSSPEHTMCDNLSVLAPASQQCVRNGSAYFLGAQPSKRTSNMQYISKTTELIRFGLHVRRNLCHFADCGVVSRARMR